MIRNIPVTAANVAAWIRDAANAVNALISAEARTEARVAVLETPETIAFIPLAAAPASPAEGLTYYDGTLHKVRTYDGTVWQDHW